MAEGDAACRVSSIPEIHDRCIEPAIFARDATDIARCAARLRAHRLRARSP